MSFTNLTKKVRRSVRIIHKQLNHKILKPLNTKALLPKKTVSKSIKTKKSSIPSFAEMVSQVSHSKQEYFTQLMLTLRYMKSLKSVDPLQLSSKSIHLAKRRMYKTAKTIIFDLDETLVHCCEDPKQAERAIQVNLPNGEKLEVGINIRPYAIECLTALSKYFEIIVFTASHKCYADVVLDILDPNNEIIHHRLYRENCINVEGVYIKDLRVLTNRDLQNVVLIDNAAYCFAYQLNNGIPIVSWHNDTEDTELVELSHYLKSLISVKDVREINRKTFHLEQLIENANTLLAKF